jgi:predicted thioesterase
MGDIRAGITGEAAATVTGMLLAPQLGSGSIEVYATPAMIALIESAAVSAIDPLLPTGQASVGIALNVEHLAATPPGQRVRAQAEVTDVEGRRVTFAVQAWDEHELIGRGTHIRYIVDVDRFVKRVGSKSGAH